MRFRDAVALLAAAVLIVAGFALAWPPLGFIAAGAVVGAAWYWLIDEESEQ